MTPRIGLRLVLILAMAGTIGCDRVTKHVATATLAGAPVKSYLSDTFRLQYAENAGAFLSLGAEWPVAARTAVFGVGSALLLTAMVVMAIRLRWSAPALIGLAFCVSGGISNLLDRIAYGKVVDFMNVGVGPLRTGIFNVADMAILLGAGIVLAVSYRADEKSRGAEDVA
jgi:signal peptidase II